MSKLTKFQQTKCLEITEKLINWPICTPFVEMVDPVRDGAPDYFEYIKKPMALSEVKRKLTANEYDTVQSWERDVNLIWQNARTYNGEDTLFTHMAMEASLWFTQRMKRFPATQEEDWTGKIQRTAKKLLDVLMHPPAELDPSGKLSAAADSGDDENNESE
jgi:hypothetical protein